MMSSASATPHVSLGFPGAIIAVSWSGFWLYLGALDLLGVRTRTAYSVVAYALIAAGLTALIWARRSLLVERIRRSSPVGLVWLVTGSLLALTFAYGALITGHGPLAHRLLGVFVISTIPATVAVAALSRRDLAQVRTALVGIALVFTLINLIASRHGAPPGERFSPIANLDPISASLISDIGCVAALTFHFGSARAIAAQASVCFALAASAMLNGSRGPVAALIVAVAFLLLIERRRATIALALSIALGIAAGSRVEIVLIGQPPALTSLVNEAHGPSKAQQPKTTSIPISSLHIRREWLDSAIHKFPEKPLFGHGIGTLVDNTPEAAAMGVKGELVYPHNDAVEALYSLGIVGGLLFALLVLLPAVSLWRNRTLLKLPLPKFVLVLFVFAFAECNFSGEIGTDAILWSVGAFAVLALDKPEPEPGS
jgi:hypothetical protein